MKRRLAWAVAFFAGLFPPVSGAATNDPVTAAREGRELARQLRESRPAADLTNTGALVIRSGRKQRRELRFSFRVSLTATNWTAGYEAGDGTNPPSAFSIEHREQSPVLYRVDGTNAFSGDHAFRPFAGSDFWMADLGMEFFQWPEQRLLRTEIKRGQSCRVLESRNAGGGEGGYSRVVSWIDVDTLGLVQAEAYDVRGRRLKEFRPTAVAKVNGAWQLKEMEIENTQTGSRTTLLFDLPARAP